MARGGGEILRSVQTDPGAHPASYTMGTGSFPGVKRLGRGVDHPPLSSAEVKETVQLYLYPLSGSSWPVPRPVGVPPVLHMLALNPYRTNVENRVSS